MPKLTATVRANPAVKIMNGDEFLALAAREKRGEVVVFAFGWKKKTENSPAGWWANWKEKK
jgi:hypothetical protein